MKPLLSILLVVSILQGCKKNNDEVKEGSKARVSVANFVTDGPAVNATIRNELVTPQPVSYGNTTIYKDSIYYPFVPGFCSVKISQEGSEDNLLGAKNNYVFGSTSAYTFFLFGAVNAPLTFIAQDIMEPVDTIAKGRFYNFIISNRSDSLDIYLVRRLRVSNKWDTVFLSRSGVYDGKTYYGLDGRDYSAFNVSIPADSFKVHMYYNHTQFIDSSKTVKVDLKKIYSFYAIGTNGAAGVNKPQVIIKQHN